VLLVEDDPHNRVIAATVLRASGYEVVLARDGEEALSFARSRPPDLVLLDLSLPKVDGYEVARRLRADPATRAVPILALTAHALKGDEAKARAAGCDGYLAKPVDPDAIVAAVDSALGGGRPCRCERA
jgi:two-component system cell cycle response regulator DivK